MTLFDGPAQIFLLIVVFCCPIIPAGGWCWLKSIECCLQCLGAIVRHVRKFAYVPMYLCLLCLLLGGCWIGADDYLESPRRESEQRSFYFFVATAVLALCTNLVSVCSTLKCLQGTLSISEQRERTVYILALPAFFGLMCFLSSQQILIYILDTVDKHWSWNTHFDSDEQRQEFTMDMVTFYMSAADVFEAFAFTFFGMLSMESLRRSARYTSRQGPREERLQGCIQRWTMSPIYMFCAVLCVESVYRLVDVFTKYFHLASIVPPALVQAVEGLPRPDDNVMRITFFTLTSVFSSLAIMALFSIEHVFHDDLLSVDFMSEAASHRCRYLANLKFWGVKIFVTLEFCLDLGMMLTSMDMVQRQLIFSLCMGSLCFLVSLLHIWAYAPRGRWIAEDAEAELPLGGGFQGEDALSVASGVSMAPLALNDALRRGALPSTAGSSCEPLAAAGSVTTCPDAMSDAPSRSLSDVVEP